MCLRLTGIQQLQLILLKIALIVAVEFHINVEFVKLLEPPEDQENKGIHPRVHVLCQNNRLTVLLQSLTDSCFMIFKLWENEEI